MSRIASRIAAALLASATLHYPALAQEFVVTETMFLIPSEGPERPDVAVLNSGDRVIVWADSRNPYGKHYEGEIWLALYDAQGALKKTFQVNASTYISQFQPSVAALADGGFVVVWADSNQNYPDTSQTAVRARRFDANGVPRDVPAGLPSEPDPPVPYGTVPTPLNGRDFQVNHIELYHQNRPAVAGLARGGFIVVWQDYSRSPDDPHEFAIRARRFGPQTDDYGDEFLVNDDLTVGWQVRPAVTALRDGGFVIAWQNSALPVTANTSTHDAVDVYARRYGVDGNPVGADGSPGNGGSFRVNPVVAGAQGRPAVTGLDEGGYLVAWVDHGVNLSLSGGAIVSHGDIRGRRYPAAPTGVTSGELQIGTAGSATDSDYPAVAALPGGRFAVAWEDRSGGSDADIRVRAFDPANGPLSTMIVNQTTANDQLYPRIAPVQCGQVLVTWHDETPPPGSTTPSVVARARVLDPSLPADPVFWARYESGPAEADAVGGLTPASGAGGAVNRSIAPWSNPGHCGNYLQLARGGDRLRYRDNATGPSPFGFATKDFSIGAWVRLPRYVDDEMAFIILDTRLPGAGAGSPRGVAVLSVFGRFAFQMTNDTGMTTWISAAEIADDDWHHVAVVVSRDGSGNAGLYVDGVKVSIDGAFEGAGMQAIPIPGVNAFDPTGKSATLGANNPLFVGFDRVLNGPQGRFQIDDILIYRRALTDPEVVALQ